MHLNEKRLRNVLKINASFSTLSGLLLIFDEPLIDSMGIVNHNVPMLIGVGLLLFASLVFYQGLRKVISIKQVRSIIVQDIAWVLASIIILIIRPWELSELGYWLIGIVAVIISVFAFFQGRYLKGLF